MFAKGLIANSIGVVFITGAESDDIVKECIGLEL